MKNILAGILLIMISYHLNSQSNFKNQKDNITNYMLKKGLEKTFNWYFENMKYYTTLKKKDITKRMGIVK